MTSNTRSRQLTEFRPKNTKTPDQMYCFLTARGRDVLDHRRKNSIIPVCADDTVALQDTVDWDELATFMVASVAHLQVAIANVQFCTKAAVGTEYEPWQRYMADMEISTFRLSWVQYVVGVSHFLFHRPDIAMQVIETAIAAAPFLEDLASIATMEDAFEAYDKTSKTIHDLWSEIPTANIGM